ncbi:MAG: GFA family protein [bacterium]|nr:GFA family protein [Gammaproteobacteria bacterium]
MAIKGSCRCGSITFEIDKASGPFELCHCNRCRKVSGSSGMAGVGVRTEHFHMLTGTELVKCYTAPLLDSPPVYQVYFCSNCGSPVPNPSPDGDWLEIAAGLFDAPLGAKPDKHIYVEFIPHWDTISDSLPRYTSKELVEYRLTTNNR